MRVHDQAEREAALNAQRSFIVQAPAGSGKTELLTQRVLELLETVEHPEEILAITFTRKAAAEMRRRVLDELEACMQPLPEGAGAYEQEKHARARRVLQRDTERSWSLQENPARLQVQTIDGFCSEVVRRLPLSSGLGGTLPIAPTPGLLYRQAARRTLEGLESGEPYAAAIELALGHLNNDSRVVIELLETMLAKRDQWIRRLGVFQGAGPGLRQRLEEGLERLVSQTLWQLCAVFPPEQRRQLQEFALHAAAHLRGSKPDSPIVLWADSAALLEETPEALSAWRGAAEMLLTQQGSWRKLVNKNNGFPADPGEPRRIREACMELLASLQEHPEQAALLDRARFLPEPHYSEPQWQVLQALFTLLEVAAVQLQGEFAAEGQVDFIEIAQGALRALEQPGWEQAFAVPLRHVLVDEFQDTSLIQFDLIRHLVAGWKEGDGRTLFLVGDPMQSIYRFREAEVSLFLRVQKEGLAELRPEPLQLTVNFRSRQGVLDWVNTHFARILPPADDRVTGAIRFAPSKSFHPAADEPVTVHPLLGAAPEEEARQVVEVVRQTLQRTRESASSRKPHTIGILVRNRSHLVEILAELKRQQVLFRAVEIEELAARPIVSDLGALTKALLHWGDRGSWLAILRAPWCGLDLLDLHRLAGDDHRTHVWALLNQQRRLRSLSPEGRKRVRWVKEALEPLLERVGRFPLRSLVEVAWARLGGPQCLQEEQALEDAETFLALLETLEGRGDLASSFLDSELQKLYARPDSSAGIRVELMTMHKSKGLQFGTVLLPGLSRQPPTLDQPLLRWQELQQEDARGTNHIDLLVAPISERGGENKDPLYAYLNLLERDKARFETGRLLYVAVTRTEQHLHLFASAKPRATPPEAFDGVSKPHSWSLASELWNALEPHFTADAPQGQPALEHTGSVLPALTRRKLRE